LAKFVAVRVASSPNASQDPASANIQRRCGGKLATA
jgi:hypothetical protein